MAGDTLWSNTALVLPGVGADNSTVFVDGSAAAQTITRVGDTKISTARSPFAGGSSILFDGSGDFLKVPMANAAMNLGSGDFCLDFWYYPVSAVTSSRVFQTRDGDVVTGVYLSHANAAGLTFYMSNNGTGFEGSGIAIPLTQNAWQYIQINKIAGVCKAYVGAVKVGADYPTTGSMYYNSADTAVIGGQTTPNRSISGNIAGFRITNGSARPVEVPTRPPATGRGELSGVVRDASLAPVERAVRAYRRDTGALVVTTTSDAVTGKYSLFTPTLDEVNVVCLDDTAGTLQNDLIVRAIPA